MPTLKLRQIPKPGSARMVLERQADATEDLGPFMLGGGDIDFLCGKCEAMLAGGMQTTTQVRDVVFRCQACGAYSESPT
jgi:hypothetical protein